MDRLYILYDARCGLCSWARRWLMRQPALIDLRFIPAGSALADRLFPGLTAPGEPPEELVVVSDQGGVYRKDNAWIMCLYALEGYREWAGRLAHPLLRPLARQAFSLLSRGRTRISRWLALASEVEIAQTLVQVSISACTPLPPPAAGASEPAPRSPLPPGRPSPATNHDVVFTPSPGPSPPPDSPP